MKKLNTFLHLTLLATLTLTLSACRFGTRTEPGTPPSPTPRTSPVDDTSGYYQTEPVELNLTVQHSTKNTAEVKDITQIPKWISSVLTNPIALIINKPTVSMPNFGDSIIVATNGSQNYFDTTVEKDRTLHYKGQTQEIALWYDTDACKTQRFVEHQGSFDDNPSKIRPDPLHSISGRLSLRITNLRTFSGDCFNSLTLMSYCYQKLEDCGGATVQENELRYQEATELFDFYIQNGALKIEEIPDLSSVAYEVKFE